MEEQTTTKEETTEERARRINRDRAKKNREKRVHVIPYRPREKHNEPKEVREHRLHLQRTARYRETHREKLHQYNRARYLKIKDIPEVKERNYARSREWYKKNPLIAALCHYKSHASVKNRSWKIDDNMAFDLFRGRCHYCGVVPEPRNGIDRRDNTRGYEYDNVLSCCSKCNYAKGTMSYKDFWDYLCRVAFYVHSFRPSSLTLKSNINDQIVTGRCRTALTQYQSTVESRGFKWELHDNIAVTMFDSACHYCGKAPSPRNGIDRKDNLRGYEPDNVVACCKTCNYAKRFMPYSEFLAYLNRISYHVFALPEKTTEK